MLRSEVLPVPFVSKPVSDVVTIERGKLKKGYVFHTVASHREYKVVKLDRVELWPSRVLIEQFAYSHEADGHFFYKTKYEDGSYRVIQGIRDAGEQIGYVEVIDVHTQRVSKMFVRVI